MVWVLSSLKYMHCLHYLLLVQLIQLLTQFTTNLSKIHLLVTIFPFQYKGK